MDLSLNLVPDPQSLVYQKGTFRVEGIPSITGDEFFRKETELFLGQLIGDLERSGQAASRDGAKKIIAKKAEGLEEEAYRLTITEDFINLEASGRPGIYHGFQTVRQLFLGGDIPGITEIPCAEIEDRPRFPWRGFMLDVSRHFYSVEFIKKIIDTLSLHHINKFHWHLTDDQGWRLPVPSYPLLTEIGSRRLDSRRDGRYTGEGFYTVADIREVVSWAADRQVEIIPEVDLPGHTSAVLAAYPGLGCTGGPYRVEDRFGIREDVLCAGNDNIFDFAAAVFDTLFDLFPSPYVHIGGDEVRFNRWEACPKCRRRLNETGLKNSRELQSWITVKLVQMLSERKRIAIGWDEVLEDTEQYPLPKEVVVMSWRGREGGIRASRLGHPVIMTPNTQGCYLDYKHRDDPEEPGQLGVSSLYQAYTMEAIPSALTGKEAERILGGQGNLWSELIYAGKIAEYMTFPRICALSEAFWSTRDPRNFETFSERLVIHQKRLDRLGVLQYRGPAGQPSQDSEK
ncbi:MAG: beta-N-acetylhexosaminidase [Treponema sp.]|jgi:hexosaminidase|nr:beta-N-acetylhexosaminidase [Treponema sp.]